MGMATDGIGDATLYIGEGDNFNYGLVNIAGFLGQCMKETIMYNACDENNWSNDDVAKDYGGQPYTAAYACGQGKLKSWTDAGMDTADESYVNACSGIVNRGCYNPPCGGN